MRRLPIFLLIDVSESMVGEQIQSLQQEMERLIQKLRRNPYVLETAYISIIAFAGKAKVIVPLTDLISFTMPQLSMGSGTSIGTALNLAMDEIDRTVIRRTNEKKGIGSLSFM